MKYLFYILATMSLFIPGRSEGQTASDALRFSRLEYNGGARNISVMSTMGALGADYGVVSTNPAGLAAFRRSELFFSLGLYDTDTEATLQGGNNTSFEDGIRRFHVQNAGLVASYKPRGGNWKTVNFAIGLTQLANYREKVFYEGLAPGSVVDRFVELADGLTPGQLDDFEGGLAWDAGAIYDINDDLFYESDFQFNPENTSLVRKQQTILRTGYLNELQLAVAGNYDDKLYLGMTIGVPILNYEENRVYQEHDDLDTIPFFNHLSWQEDLTSTGTGINLKLGFIYRVNQMIRLGGAIHTPTAFRITDNYSKTLDYNYTENGVVNTGRGTSPEGAFDYRLYTPWRLLGNAGVIIGKKGFISAEVEWVDYSTSSYNFTPEVNNPAFQAAERRVNSQIAESFQDALNIRLGGELAHKIFRFRAGLGFSGTEYANDNLWSRSWSAGFGIREDNFYIDFGFRQLTREESFIPYETSVAPELNITTSRVQNLFALTLGIKL